jgi:hypothetical protein
MFSSIKPGDEVAIMPSATSPAGDVLGIARVVVVSAVYIQLDEGRMYATIGGKSLLTKPVTYIVPATDEHRAALAAKRPQSA